MRTVSKRCPLCSAENEPTARYCYRCGAALDEERHQIAGMLPAGFWIRLAAYLIDSLILFSFGLIIGGFLAFFWGWSVEGLEVAEPQAGPFFDLAGAAMAAAYFTFCLGRWGRTPGKLFLGLKVVRTDGSPLGYGRSLARWACYFISSLVFGLGFIWIAFHPQKRGWHDLICDTRVVRLGHWRERGGPRDSPIGPLGPGSGQPTGG